jgi:hypothetical protein
MGFNQQHIKVTNLGGLTPIVQHEKEKNLEVSKEKNLI